MISTIPKKHFDLVLEDLKYAKEFKTHSVLFTNEHSVIGLGEAGSYFRIEVGNEPKRSYLYDMIIETRSIQAVLKAADAGLLGQFIINPLMLTDTNGLVSIASGLHPQWIETMVFKSLKWCTPFTQIYEEDITNSDEVKALKKLKADEGNILLKRMIENKPHIIPMNKKFIPLLASDKLTIRIFDESIMTFYVCFIIETKNERKFFTYIRCLRV